MINNNDLVYKDELGNIIDGYRVVYYYDNDKYLVGSFCKTIEGFMMEFVEVEPIEDESDIPEFISIRDILERELKSLKETVGVSIYKTNGELIDSLFKDNKSK